MRRERLSPAGAVTRIRDRGALLVFPIKNAAEPASLWSEFYPKSEMLWEWTEDSDARIGNLWQLMKQLSDSQLVVYSKWYQGRATFFSRELFTAMLCVRRSYSDPRHKLSATGATLLEVLENNSPLSTKELKRVTDLQGRLNEGAYNRGMKELFSRLLIVGFGEVEDGAFPSLAVGATELLFEDLWRESAVLDLTEARRILDRLLPMDSHFRRFFDKGSHTIGIR